MSLTSPDTTATEVAFYYPGWIWNDFGFSKNLLLFFDGVALLVPEYMQNRVDLVDHELTVPLLDAGLLHKLKPEDLVDKAATEKLARSLADILETGALDSLASGAPRFHELSYSRLGGFGDQQLADGIIHELKARGLAGDSKDMVHPSRCIRRSIPWCSFFSRRSCVRTENVRGSCCSPPRTGHGWWSHSERCFRCSPCRRLAMSWPPTSRRSAWT